MSEHATTSGEDHKALIRDAVRIVGPEDPNDYTIKPSGFAAMFAESAGEFSELLDTESLRQTAARYEQRDEQALEAQRRFRRLSARATVAVFCATVAAAILTSLGSLGASGTVTDDATLIELPALLLGLVALGAGAYAAMLLFQINGGRLLSRWMSLRAAAETERLAYFNKLVRLVEASHVDNSAVQLLSLELFRRYQLGIQQVYYSHRGEQHRKSMDKTLRLGAVAAGILAVGSGSVGIVGFFKPELLPLAAIGLLGSALSTVASRREELNQDERNAERYDRTADVLSHLREKHTEVQHALAEGKLNVLAEYVAAVHEQLSLEHRQWLAQAEAVESALEKLNASLRSQPSGAESDAK